MTTIEITTTPDAKLDEPIVEWFDPSNSWGGPEGTKHRIVLAERLDAFYVQAFGVGSMWHKEPEWYFVIEGSDVITALVSAQAPQEVVDTAREQFPPGENWRDRMVLNVYNDDEPLEALRRAGAPADIIAVFLAAQ